MQLAQAQYPFWHNEHMTTNQINNTQVNLAKFAWMSIVVSVVVFGMKMAAWWATGSVGLLSDALESTVNIVAAVVALFALRTAMKPADELHHFGRFQQLLRSSMVVPH